MAGRSPKIDLPLISVTLTLSVMAWKDSSSFAKKDFKVCGDASHGVSVKKNRIESDDKTCGVVVLKKPMKAGAAYKLTFKDHCEAGGDKNGREPLLTLGFGVTDTLEIEGEQVHGEAIDSGFIWQTAHPDISLLCLGGFGSIDDIMKTKFTSVRNGSTVCTSDRSSKAPKKCELVFNMRGEKASLELTAADGQDQCVSDIEIEEGKDYYFCFFLYSWADNTDVVTIESIKKIAEGENEEEEEEEEEEKKEKKVEKEDKKEKKQNKRKKEEKEEVKPKKKSAPRRKRRRADY